MKELLVRTKYTFYQAMIEFSSPTKKSWDKIEHSVRMMMLLQLTLLLAGQILVFAATESTTAAEAGGGSGNSSNAKTLVGNLASIMVSIFKYVGMAIIVYGIIQFLMAIKKSDAESKSDAILWVLVGVGLMSLPTLITAMGIDLKVTSDKL